MQPLPIRRQLGTIVPKPRQMRFGGLLPSFLHPRTRSSPSERKGGGRRGSRHYRIRVTGQRSGEDTENTVSSHGDKNTSNKQRLTKDLLLLLLLLNGPRLPRRTTSAACARGGHCCCHTHAHTQKRSLLPVAPPGGPLAVVMEWTQLQ